ncbi:Tol-Pal system beta propeller repeat protein TolB [Desulfosoma caldarium]|nr:Tol-Pal system beta propeller repeat protein TolB [Desulfosoma caldarium]
MHRGWPLWMLLLGVWAACFCLSVSTAWAAERVYIDITQPGFVKLPIAVPDFKAQGSEEPSLAHEMADVIADDLDFSGYFKVLDPAGFLESPQQMGVLPSEIRFDTWKALGAEFLARGLYEVRGGSLNVEFRLFDVISQKMVLGKAYEARVSDAVAVAHRIANEIIAVLTGEPGIFDTRIAFVQAEKGVKEIYVMDVDGRNLTPITRDGTIALSPAWSPDGTQLAFVSYLEGQPKIFVAKVFSGSRRAVIGYPGINITPAWHPTGGRLAATLSKDGNPDIFLIDTQGSILQKLVGSWAIEVSPSWSPDGSKLAYVSNESGNPQIYVLDVTSGNKRRLTYEGKYNTSPAWSPKGDWIAFSGMAGGTHNIFIIRPDGSGLRALTHGEGSNESPTWSPDGRLIAFSSTREGPSAIWVMVVNGEGTRRLTRMEGAQSQPSWSPRSSR